MKQVTRLVLVAALLGWIVPVARADQPQGVWRFVDASTMLVARLDLAGYDRAAVEQWLGTIIRANTDAKTAGAVIGDIHDAPPLAFPEELKKAGAKEFFVVGSLSGFPKTLGWIAIPIPAGGDGQAIAGAFFKGVGLKPSADQPMRAGAMAAVVMNDMLLISNGNPKGFEHFAAADRPELAKAFADAGSAPLVVAVAPSEDTRKVIEQMLPQLPPPASVPSTVLTRGVKSAYLAVTLPPEPSLHLLIQSDSAEDAKNLNDLIGRFLAIGRQDTGFRREVASPDEVIDAVTPKLEGDHLTIAIDHAKVDRVVAIFATGLARAREHAFAMQSASNLKQIGLGLILYANEHKEAYPDKLEQIAEYLGGKVPFQKITTDPQRPQAQLGYIYVKPAFSADKGTSGDLVAYESFDAWPTNGLFVLFADGHVEQVQDQARFQALLAKAQVPAK